MLSNNKQHFLIFLICLFSFLALSAIEGWFFIPQKALAADEDLIINEIFPYPSTNFDEEFIELYNRGETAINLSNWQLDDRADGGADPYKIKADTTISGYSYLVFYKSETGIGLNNDGDSIRLIRPDESEISAISYTKAQKDMSYVRDVNNIWFWTEFKTPGDKNPDRPQYSREVYINEILPRPSTGADNEFIELYNSGDSAVDLSGWTLDDQVDGGASPYQIEQGTVIGPKSYLLFYKSKTGLTLNDDGDEVNLIDPIGEKVSSIPYSSAKKDETYIRTDKGFWRWSIVATPLSQNILRDSSTAGFASSFEEPIAVKTGEIASYEGKRVEIIGEVVETSGSTFYLNDGSGRVKVYIQAKTGIKKPRMSKKDIVRVRGRVDFYRGAWRILPQYQSDIEIIEGAKGKVQNTEEKTTISKSAAAESEKSPNYIPNSQGLENSKLLEEILNQAGQVKGQSAQNLFNKIIISVIIIAVILLGLLIGGYLWKTQKRPSTSLRAGKISQNAK